ncbi:MAG: hypothetical protein QG574_4252 [Cyanobacteriota bacterium erpe_2018_sw_21hr_WHONDRS-SW48-000092_B_bin.40]|nr:hypothetical protein [Cyanobacteriota bacterium erpe_2018_sw_21hr_WHONDRS-SW48-000092_B_bin.40]
MRSFKLPQKLMILVSVPLIFGLLFTAILTVLLKKADLEIRQEQRAKSLISQAQLLTLCTNDALIYMGGYSATHSKISLSHYEQSCAETVKVQTELHRLVGDDMQQKEILKRIDSSIAELIEIFKQTKEGSDTPQGYRGHIIAFKLYGMVQKNQSKLRGELNELTADAKKQEESTKADIRSAINVVLIVGTLLNILLTVVLTLYLGQSFGKRLNILTDNAMRLASGEELNPPAKGNDEIAELDAIFHKMAATLAEASRKERATIENALDVICSIESSGRFTNVSPAAKTVWSYEPSDLVGRRYIDILAKTDAERIRRIIEDTVAKKATCSFEADVVRPDATEVAMLWTARWSDIEKSLFCVAHDISERKRAENLIKASEERIRSIIRHLPVGTISISPGGTIESVNPKIEELFEYSESQLVGSPITKLLAAEALNLEEFGRFTERVGQKSNGNTFPVELTLTKFEDLEAKHFLISLQDITERRNIEQMKQDFVAMVSHDLRTPLGSIQAVLTLIEEGVYGQIEERGLVRIRNSQKSLQRLTGLVNNLLDLEKMESGKLTIVPEPTSLKAIVTQSLESVSPHAEQQKVSIELNCEDAQLTADGDRLVQVVINLLSNAIKFSTENSTICLSCAFKDNWAEVKIVDSGRGIPKNMQELIFEKFQQAQTSDGKRGRGTGLGLPICKAIVEAHGGQIGVESEEGKGSNFWFRIPLITRV